MKKRNVGIIIVGLLMLSFVTTSIYAGRNRPQPRMKAALTALKTAERNLKTASHNKGGHRAKAIALVKKAISEVQKGVAAGNQ